MQAEAFQEGKKMSLHIFNNNKKKQLKMSYKTAKFLKFSYS